jgi:hypothetical protein
MNTSIQILCSFCILLFCGLTSCGQTSQPGHIDQSKQAMKGAGKTGKQRLMIAVVNQTPNIEDSLGGRFDAALNLIAQELPDRFELVTLEQRNDAIRELEADDQEPTAAKIADKLDVDRLLFLQAGRLENMFRVGLIMTQAPDYIKSQNGTGYALIRYRREETGQRIYDTALLEALQRALADATGDSTMFAQAKELAPVRPAPPVVIGGIQFESKNVRPVWSLYEDKVTVSYEMILQIFDVLKDNPNYVAYDLDSRDTMYAMRNLYMVENYRLPSPQEMSMLERFEVHHLVSGIFERTSKDEAVLTLQLGQLNRGMYTTLGTQKISIREDSREKLMEAVRLQRIARNGSARVSYTQQGFTMEVFLCRGFSGQIYRINVSDEAPMHMLMPVMANAVGLYTRHEERLGVYNLTRDIGYGDNDTLSSRKTQEGDLLIIADGGACHKRSDGHWEGMGHEDEEHAHDDEHEHSHDYEIVY